MRDLLVRMGPVQSRELCPPPAIRGLLLSPWPAGPAPGVPGAAVMFTGDELMVRGKSSVETMPPPPTEPTAGCPAETGTGPPIKFTFTEVCGRK